MTIKIDMTRDELLKEVRQAAGDAVAEKMQAAEERVRELDDKVDQLASSGAEGKFKDAWERGLQNGKPLIMPNEGSVDDVIAGAVRKMSDTKENIRHHALIEFRAMRAMAAAHHLGRRATPDDGIEVARSWGDEAIAGILEATRDWYRDLKGSKAAHEEATRALGTTVIGSGGAFIAPKYAGFIVDFRHPKTHVRQHVSRLPMPGGTLSMPFVATGASAEFAAEHSGAYSTEPGDALLEMARKILKAYIAISRQLIAEADIDVDVFYLRHLVKRMNAREDLALIRGDGTANTPRGMKYWIEQSSAGGEAHAFNRTLDGGVPTVSTITADALKCPQLVEDSDVDIEDANDCRWLMAVRSFYGLAKQRNATTQREIWPELRTGMFYGHPLSRVTQIPKTLAGDGAGNGTNNKAELYFGAMSSFILGDTKNIEARVFDGGAYKDANGDMQSGITNSEVVLHTEQGLDFAASERGAEGAMIKSVDWGV